METSVLNAADTTAAFYTPVTIRTLGIAAADVASWDIQFVGDQYVGRASVLTKNNGGKLPGLYVFTDRGYQFMIGYEDFCGLVAQGSSFDIVYNVAADFAIPSGGVVWFGGDEVTLDPIPANRPVPYVVAVPGAETSGGGGGGAVTSVNGQTGVVVLTAANVGAATTAQGAKADSALQAVPIATTTVLGGVKQGTGVTVAGDGTLSRNALVAADIPSLDAGKITTGTFPVARGGTGAATLTGYVKGTGTTAMTASATVPVGDISGTLPVANGGTGAVTFPNNSYLKGALTGAVTGQTGIPASDISSGTILAARLPVATAAAQGIMQVGAGLAVTAGTVSVAAVGATAGNIGGVTRQAAIADATGWTDPGAQTNFNALLAALRSAGILVP